MAARRQARVFPRRACAHLELPPHDGASPGGQRPRESSLSRACPRGEQPEPPKRAESIAGSCQHPLESGARTSRGRCRRLWLSPSARRPSCSTRARGPSQSELSSQQPRSRSRARLSRCPLLARLVGPVSRADRQRVAAALQAPTRTSVLASMPRRASPAARSCVRRSASSAAWRNSGTAGCSATVVPCRRPRRNNALTALSAHFLSGQQ